MTSPAALVQQLRSVLDQLAGVELSTLAPDELQQHVVALQREQARVAVVAADAVPAWLASRAWRSGGTLRPELAIARDARRDRTRVKAELRRARVLASLPITRQAVLDGRISMDHVDLLVRHATKARFELFRQCEQWLVDRCVLNELFDDAARDVQYWAMWADDQLGVRREPSTPSTLYASQSETTGRVVLDGDLAAIDGAIVTDELGRLANEILHEDRRNGVRRTPAQRRAAALVRMATRSVNAAGPTARPLFEVVIGDETARHLCQLATGLVLHPEDLMPYFDTAAMQSFLFDAGHAVVGVSKQRTFRGALRRAIQVRDRRCRHRSVCPEPAVRCDVDHRTPAARGGPTSQFNGAAECMSHNRHPDLHGHPEPMPECDLTILDVMRAKARWAALRHLDVDDAGEEANAMLGPFTSLD